MTTELAVEFLDAEAAAAASGQEQFNGAIYASSPWEVSLIRRVLRLHERYPDRVTEDVLDRAILLIGQIAGLHDAQDIPDPFVGPVRDGGVVFEWARESRQLNIAVLPEGTTEFLQWESSEEFSEGELPARFAGRLLELINWLTSPGG
jgi:hypothetical protein